MAKTACHVVAVLLDDEFTRQKRQCDLATLCVFRNKCRDVAFDRCFTFGITAVHALNNIHIYTIKLNFEFVMAERENPEFTSIEAVDAVHLGRGNRSTVLGVSRDRSYCKT